MASWLVLQYNFNHNYPSIGMRTGARLLLSVLSSFLVLHPCSPSPQPPNRFTSTWTSLTAGAYTLLFLHPAWSKHPIASVGAQAIWVFITWLFWVVGASIVNKTISSLVDEKACGSVAYCAQIRGLFGAFLLPCPLRFLCEMKSKCDANHDFAFRLCCSYSRDRKVSKNPMCVLLR
jgi:hypothetical protein